MKNFYKRRIILVGGGVLFVLLIVIYYLFSSFGSGNGEFEGQFCGGIVNIRCPEGYRCVLDGNYPDAGGRCVGR